MHLCSVRGNSGVEVKSVEVWLRSRIDGDDHLAGGAIEPGAAILSIQAVVA